MQKLPHKKKTNKKTLSEADLKAKDKFYKELAEFYELNENTQDDRYIAEFDNSLQKFVVKDYDHSKFETYGKIIDKKLYLTHEETIYLNQIGLIKYTSDPNSKYLDIANHILYGYLRRAGKIVISVLNLESSTHLNDFKDYFIIFSTLEDYKNKYPEFIVKVFPNNHFNYSDIENILEDSEKIKNIFPMREGINISIALVKQTTIHILSLNEINLLNI